MFNVIIIKLIVLLSSFSFFLTNKQTLYSCSFSFIANVLSTKNQILLV